MTSRQVPVAQAPRTEAVGATSLAARLNVIPRVADEARAQARFDDFVSHIDAETTALDLIRSERVQALLLAIADHSPFLWRLIANDPVRVGQLLRAAPEGRLDDLLSNL